MNKIIAYYSLIIVILATLFCLFDSEGDSDTFIGGIMFIPVAYSIWQMIIELKVVEKENKKREEMRRDEEIREEMRKELK